MRYWIPPRMCPVEKRRDDPSSQDFGATLILLLGAPAAVAVAKGIGQWLSLYRSAKVRIEQPNGTLIAENITSKQVFELAKLLQKDMSPPQPPNPETTLAIILGASAWPHLTEFQASPAFKRSAEDFS